MEIADLPSAPHQVLPEHETLVQRQKMFGYTYEDVRKVLVPMALTGIDPLGAMGIDSPIAVLSNQAQPFVQLFQTVVCTGNESTD